MAVDRTTENRITAAINEERAQAVRQVWQIGIPLAIGASIIYPTGILAWAGALALWYNSAKSCGSFVKLKGAAGEDRVETLLSDLPNGYLVYNQIKFPEPSSCTGFLEADFVVVGKNGVFIIENKDYTGRIVGNESDRDWTLYKMGRDGTWYGKKARNPVRQVKTYVRKLSDIFRENGIKAWIVPLVSYMFV